MADVAAIAGSNSGLRQLSLMGVLFGSADSGRRVATRVLYQEARDRGQDRSMLTSDFQALSERGWLWFEEAASGIDDVVLTQSGIDAVEEFESLRSSPQKRNMDVRDHLLRWLYDAYLVGGSPSAISDFAGTPDANFYGLPFTATEVERAGEWLHTEGFISGTKTWGGEILRPGIKSKGSRVVESGASVNAHEGSGGTTVNNSVNIKGSHAVNVAVGSSDVHQSNTLTKEQIKQTANFIGSTRDLLSALGLSGEQQEIVGEIVDELETETTSAAPRQSKMKELAGKVVDIVVTGTATGMVNALVAMGNSVILGLG